MNPKPVWNYVKSKRKGTNVLTSLEVNGKNITDDFGIAETMNQFFSSVFTSENMDNFPEFDYVCDQKLSDIQCSTTEVENHLKVLDIYKSPGPDNISPRVLRECAAELAPSLCILLNKSFSTGQLLCSWKIANITPLHKKGSKHSRNNYRQISLTSIIVKVGEKIVKNRVFHFWLDQNIFNPNQYAYLSGKSTLTQLLSCFDDWSKSRNKSKSTDVVFLDFSKAFDSVPHERLLFKLKRYGIDDSLLL